MVETAPRPGENNAEWLTRVERDQTHPNVRPRDAATLILIDRTASEPKVLLGRRHDGHKFMPGKYVFPGGRAEAADRAMPIASPLHPKAEQRLMRLVQRPSTAKARGLAVTAIREVAEETGLLVGKRGNGPFPPKIGPWQPFADAGIALDLSPLHFIARAITPPRRPRRFDTRFFAIDTSHIAHRIDGVIGPDTELVELIWMPIATARELDMPTVTKVVLTELQRRIASGFSHEAPVPYFRMLNRRFVQEFL